MFLALFSYTVLVRMEPRPSVPEWLVFAYISSTAVDKIREVSLKRNSYLLETRSRSGSDFAFSTLTAASLVLKRKQADVERIWCFVW